MDVIYLSEVSSHGFVCVFSLFSFSQWAIWNNVLGKKMMFRKANNSHPEKSFPHPNSRECQQELVNENVCSLVKSHFSKITWLRHVVSLSFEYCWRHVLRLWTIESCGRFVKLTLCHVTRLHILHVFLDPFHPSISKHIFHTVFCTFPKVLTGIICLTVKSLLSWWSLPLFSWH